MSIQKVRSILHGPSRYLSVPHTHREQPWLCGCPLCKDFSTSLWQEASSPTLQYKSTLFPVQTRAEPGSELGTAMQRWKTAFPSQELPSAGLGAVPELPHCYSFGLRMCCGPIPEHGTFSLVLYSSHACVPRVSVHMYSLRTPLYFVWSESLIV